MPRHKHDTPEFEEMHDRKHGELDRNSNYNPKHHDDGSIGRQKNHEPVPHQRSPKRKTLNRSSR